MTQQGRHKFVELDQYISEECVICGDELTSENDIFVTKNDRYICSRCMIKHNINAVDCFDISIN